MHDAHGEHPLSSEGHLAYLLGSVSFPSFSSDGKHLYYLLRRESPGAPSELWRTDLASNKSEDVLPGVLVLEYDISSDGKEVVFSTQPSGKSSQLWLASLDRSSPPRQIASSGENSPHFGADGEVLFRLSEGKINYLYRMNRDGSGRAKVVPYPISTVQNISPDRRWLAAMLPEPGGAVGIAS